MRMFCFATLAVFLLCVGCSKQPDHDVSSDYPSIYFTEDYHRIGDHQLYVCFGTSFENSVERLTFLLFEKVCILNLRVP